MHPPCLSKVARGSAWPVASTSLAMNRCANTTLRCAAVTQRNIRCSSICANSSSSNSSSSNDLQREEQLRIQLGRQFPNALLLEPARLPPLRTSKHFLNLTNGMEMAPLLHHLQLPFSVVRMRSTCLEQQAFEALVLELDANLLLAAALGHSCIVWDCGCRNKHNGAPRALWYGLEFVRFALQHFWLGAGGPAHLRGHNVSREFEAACRRFHPSTKKRLRYYKRYLAPQVQQRGVQLHGFFKRTQHDEDYEFFVDLAQQHCGSKPLEHQLASAAVSKQALLQDQPALQAWGDAAGAGSMSNSSISSASGLPSVDLDAYELLLAQGVGVFASGISHQQYIDLSAAMSFDQERR